MRRPLQLIALVAVAMGVGLAAGGDPPFEPQSPGLAVGGPAAAVRPTQVTYSDPFPIQRIRASESQLPSIFKQPDAGPLVRLLRNDFEERVRAAGKLATEARELPRITHSRYLAKLSGNDLVGTAELDVVNPGYAPQLLSLDPLRLALTSAAWGDGREAVIGVPPGGNSPSVWVDRAEAQTLKLAWSAAGTVEFGERRFELRVPAALTIVLDLEIPAGQRPTVPSDVLLTGPFPVQGDSSKSTWRFRFGGKPRLDFAIRSPGILGKVASSSLVARYNLSPGQLSCSFEYDLRPAKGTVGEWSFTVDPGLRISDVVVNNRAGWKIDAPATPGGQRQLRVSLNQPGIGGRVMLLGVAPFPDSTRPADAPLPAVRPIGAVVDDETLEIHLAPKLKPARWSPGDYRIVDSQLLPDQSHTFNLYGTLLPAGADRLFRQLPAIAANPTEPEFSTREQLTWRFDSDRVTIQLQLGIRLRRGPLYRLAVRPPQGYALVQATSPQDDLIASSQFSGGNAIVDFSRPLLTDQVADLVFEFRGPPTGPNQFPFPAVTPEGATERIGVLGIIPGSLWGIDARPGVGMTPTSWLDFSSLQPPAGATVAYRYRGGNPDGWAKLVPVRPEFTVDQENQFEQSSDKLVARTTFTLRVLKDSLPTIFVTEQQGGFADRTWAVIGGRNAIASATHVPLANLMRQFALLIPGLPGRLTVLPSWGNPQGRLWIIRFDRPVTGEIVMETSSFRPIPKGLNASALSTTELAILGSAKTRLVSSPSTPTSTDQAPTKEWSFSDLYLATVVRTQEDAEMVFGGTVNVAAAGALPIQLPPGAVVRTASVGGRILEGGAQQPSATGILSIPLPAEAVRFEVRYRLPIDPAFPTSIRSPEPGLPGVGGEIHRWWVFASAVLPVWPVSAWERGKSADLPVSKDDFPIVGSSYLVSRSPLAEVTVASSKSAYALGIALSLGLFLLGWMGSRNQHRIHGLLAFSGLLLLGMANLLGPPWWQRAASLPLAIGLLATAGMVLFRGRRSAAAIISGVVFICILTDSNVPAQPPAPATVVILPANAEGTESVIAPKAVLDRLSAIRRPLPPGTLITAADYAVNIDESVARVVARFTAHALSSVNPTVTLPLIDARLERMTVDGSLAYPQAPRPGSYTVPLPAAGRHEIEVRFTVPFSATGTERELRFGSPECPTTRVTAEFPPTARQIQILGRTGKQKVEDASPRRLEADLGSVKAIQLRWRDGVGGTASIKAREACVWDVSEKGAELTACYIIRIEQGSVSRLQFDLPGELEPTEVSLRPDATGSAALRDWSLGESQGTGTRQLRLDLQGPTTGRVLVVLTCRLRRAVTQQPLLRFPKPVLPGGSAEPDVALGLRARDVSNKVTIEAVGQVGTIDYDPEILIRDKEWTQVAALRLDASTPIRVFRPSTKSNPELRPTLRPAWNTAIVNLETNWQVAPHRADADGTVHWQGKELRSLIEFTIPGLKILEVRGPDVLGWSQSAGRVSVWLRKPTSEGELEWMGTTTPLPIGQKPPEPFPFEAQVPRVSDTRLGSTLVRLRTLDIWNIRMVRDQGWTGLNRRDNTLALQTSNPAALPVRIALVPATLPNPPETVTQLSPPPRLRSAADIAADTENRSGTSDTGPANGESDSATVPSLAWTLPVSALAVWCLAILFLAFLFFRFPRATWPEQFGVLVGLFGMLVVGNWWFALAGWVIGRALWLAGVKQRSSEHMEPT